MFCTHLFFYFLQKSVLISVNSFYIQALVIIWRVSSCRDNKAVCPVFSSSIERLRAERLQREAEERRKTQALIDQRSGKGKDSGREVQERDMPYNSAFFPELARKRQRRDRDSWRDEILKS